MADSAAFSGPRDAAVMEAILKEMGIEDYEPNVIHQMLEFSYSYVTNVLEDACVYSEHAQKKELDISDVKLAVQTRMDHSFTAPPPRDFLIEIARKKNSTALPLIPEKFGPRLPPERYCLTANNYKVMEQHKQSSVNKPQVTLSATFRVPGKPTTATGSTAITSPSSPSSSSSSMLRTQLSSPLLQTTSNPLTSPSVTKFSQAPNILTQLKQQQQQQQQQQHGPLDQAGKSASNRNTNNSVTSFSGLLGKHALSEK